MTGPQWLNEQEMAAWTALLESSHLVVRRVEQQLRDDAGLSHQQYEILVGLSNAPGREMRMTELAEQVVTSKSGLTYQVSRLEKAGLVWRRSCLTDERGINAVLTEEGVHTLRKAAPGHVAQVRSSLIDLLTREQLAALTAGLNAVTSKLRQSDAG